MPRHSDVSHFYDLVADLERRVGGRRVLASSHGRQLWPERGVYFLFEPNEHRESDVTASRVIRVGTHALKTASKTTIWRRLSQHRGTQNPLGGNHRGSIFRLLVGEALMRRDPAIVANNWGRGSTAIRDIRLSERPLEEAVSHYLGALTLLVLPVPDPPGSESLRGFIERNSIALLSNLARPSIDPPSATWLGKYSGRERVRLSGLWNNNHVNEEHQADFLTTLARLIKSIPA